MYTLTNLTEYILLKLLTQLTQVAKEILDTAVVT